MIVKSYESLKSLKFRKNVAGVVCLIRADT